MKTYPLLSDGGIPFSFEIENAYISRREAARLIQSHELVTNVKLRSRFGSSDDIRVRFNYAGENFVVWEPYGDNSRYWVGPEELKQPLIDISDLKKVFDAYRPSMLRHLIGNLVSLPYRVVNKGAIRRR